MKISSKKVKVQDVKNEAFVRDVSKSESGKCENEARARLASKSESGRCANEAFVRDLLQNLKAAIVKTKRLCEASSKSEGGRCENEAFVRDFPV